MRKRKVVKHKFKKYGWRPALPDHRDIRFAVGLSAPKLPAAFDLRSEMPKVYDQGSLGSCVSNGVAAVMEHLDIKLNKSPFLRSRLFIYYQARALDGNIQFDAGTSVKQGMNVVHKYGACHEKYSPYLINNFTKRPSNAAYRDALWYKTTAYQNVDNTNALTMKTALFQHNPIVFGMTLYEGFESNTVAQTGIVAMPQKKESIIGGHCMVVCGWTEDNYYLVRNSWGTGWGMGGYCKIPVAYLSNPNLASDFWIATGETYK